jgi:hypothetical protein
MNEYRIVEERVGAMVKYYVESKENTFFGRLFGWSRHSDVFTNYIVFDDKEKAKEWVKKCKDLDNMKTIIHEA